MTREEAIQWLITNSNNWGDPGDAEILSVLSDEKLGALVSNAEEALGLSYVANASLEGFEDNGRKYFFDPEKAQFMVANCGDMGGGMGGAEDGEEMEEEEEEESQFPPKKEKGPPAVNSHKPLTINEWLPTVPPEFQGIVTNALAHDRQQKAELIKQLVDNSNPEVAKAAAQTYASMTTNQLRSLVAAMPKPSNMVNTQDLSLNYLGAAGAPIQRPDSDKNDILPLPTVNYEALSQENSGRRRASN